MDSLNGNALKDAKAADKAEYIKQKYQVGGEDDNDEQDEVGGAAVSSNMGDEAKGALYTTVSNLLTGNETVFDGLRRLGKIKKKARLEEQKRKKMNKNRRGKNSVEEGEKEAVGSSSSGGGGGSAASAEECDSAADFQSKAMDCFNQLTEAADALMSAGEADIYEMKRGSLLQRGEEIIKKWTDSQVAAGVGQQAGGGGSSYFGQESQQQQVQSKSSQQHEAHGNDANDSGAIMWEYKGQDGNIHGPFTSSQMLSWRSQGFFAGASAVDVRIYEASSKAEAGSKPEAKSGGNADLMDELMDDFDDDDDDDDDDGDKGDSAGGAGNDNPWKRSDAINFAGFC